VSGDVTLLGDVYAPVTSSIGFLDAPAAGVAGALRDWRRSIHGRADALGLEGGLVDNVARLEPLTGGVRPRELVVATAAPGWTAVFDCGVQGGDQVTTVGYLARTMAVQGVVVLSVPDQRPSDGLPERYGARQLQLFAPIPTDFLNYVRTISVVRDGARWRFDANGLVQDFEREDAYQRRKVTDRFPSELLVEYAVALGLRPFEADFYPGPSVLVTNPAVPPAGGWELSIAETQRRRGIVPQGSRGT